MLFEETRIRKLLDDVAKHDHYYSECFLLRKWSFHPQGWSKKHDEPFLANLNCSALIQPLELQLNFSQMISKYKQRSKDRLRASFLITLTDRAAAVTWISESRNRYCAYRSAIDDQKKLPEEKFMEEGENSAPEECASSGRIHICPSGWNPDAVQSFTKVNLIEFNRVYLPPNPMSVYSQVSPFVFNGA